MKVARYTWGEFNNVEELSKQYLKGMRKLTKTELLGFSFRKQDVGKDFYAEEEYIDSGADGTTVKFSYALEK